MHLTTHKDTAAADRVAGLLRLCVVSRRQHALPARTPLVSPPCYDAGRNLTGSWSAVNLVVVKVVPSRTVALVDVLFVVGEDAVRLARTVDDELDLDPPIAVPVVSH